MNQMTDFISSLRPPREAAAAMKIRDTRSLSITPIGQETKSDWCQIYFFDVNFDASNILPIENES